jgi:hypothetical protein
VALVPVGGLASGVAVRVLGTLAVAWSRTDLGSALQVSSTSADDLRVVASATGRSLTEAYRQIRLSRTLRDDEARSTISLALLVDSDVLDATLSVSTPVPLKAYLNTYPESGRIELRGAGAAVARLKPHVVNASGQFDAELDSNGDGTAEQTLALPWRDATDGFLWWDGRSALNWTQQPYSTQAFIATGFSDSLANAGTLAVNDAVRLQFSRVPVAVPALSFRFRDSGGTRANADATLNNVAADLVQQGAVMLIRPRTPLRHARSYALEGSADGLNWGSGLTLRDALNNTLTLPGVLLAGATPDTLRAAITPSALLLSGASASLQLDICWSTTARAWRKTRSTAAMSA